MSEIFFTSDSHYDHVNICRGTTSWERNQGDQRVRDFDSLEEMNNKLVNGINDMVAPNDVLYHLGDWSFNGEANISEFRGRINCNNVHLIYGNHDQHIENEKKGYQALFSSVGYYKKLQYARGKYDFICLLHYALRVWESSHKGSLHLYGHSHGTLPDAGNRSMDVGVDTNNLFPYHLDEILELKKREVMVVDHHTSKTN